MENRSMTGQESLELIARMIKNAQTKMERRAGRPFLIWGYVTIAVSLAVWYLFGRSYNPAWMWLWFGIPVLGGAVSLLFPNRAAPQVKTYIDRVINEVWLIIGICAVLAALYALLFTHGDFPILFVEALIVNAGIAISGGVVKLSYIKLMGIAGILLSFALLFVQGIDQIPVFAVIALVCMVIPGHLMNYQAGKSDNP